MKKIYAILLLGLFCLVHSYGYSQDKNTKTRRPALRFGINFGSAWQTSDVRWVPGGGVGATLEVPIIENDNSLIGVSLRGRYLFSGTYGRDWQRSLNLNDLPLSVRNSYSGLGYYYANHRTRSHNWDLELMLKANRLRARTGILAYIWGGIGPMGYRSKIDQLDNTTGSAHDYSNIPTGDKFEALNELDFEWDGNWETEAVAPRRPHWVWAPSLGIGLGYEFSPVFSMAFEYKVTFPFTDYLDGKAYERDGQSLSDRNDIHHYGGFGLYFGMFGGGSTSTRPPRPRPTSRPTAVRPRISMVSPTVSNVTVQSPCVYDMQARLFNVRNKQLITIVLNGYTLNPQQYSYDPGSGTLRSRLQLRTGPNNVKIVARNQHGTDSHSFTATCQNVIVPPPPPTGLPPEVYITYPTGCPAVIHNCRTDLYAEVIRVRSKADITVFHQNQRVSPQFYTYDLYSQRLTMNVELNPGDNRFEIVARNQFGSDRASTVLRCPTQVVLPSVVITKPSTSPFSSTNCTQMLEAKVTGVRSRNEIAVYVDGVKQPNTAWSWSAGTTILRMTLNLTQGRNANVEIIANNGNGSAADVQILRCEQTLPPPQVIIINPANGNFSGKDCNQRIVARVLNVSGKQDIRVMKGNSAVAQKSWTYNTFNQLLVMDVTLTPGVQTLYTINATNTVGSDSKTATLRCQNETVKMITICNIPPGNPAGAQTQTIPANQWPTYQANGAVQGPCSNQKVQICMNGNEIQVSQTALQAALSMGATQGPCPVSTIQICNYPPTNPAAATTITIKLSEWPTYQANGAVKGPCSKQKTKVCWQGREVLVSRTLLPSLKAQGAIEGPCPTAMLVICNIPPGNPAGAQTITIPADQWPTYQAKGAVKGACSKNQITICMDGNEFQISQTALQTALAMGATQGPCRVSTIQICHYPPKNPAAASTMTIKVSEWPSYQARGAVKGPCSQLKAKICFQGKEIMVPANMLPSMKAQGATQGPCPTAMLVICNIPPGNPAGAQTITIPADQWPTYQVKGAVKGACSKNQVKICMDGNEVQISQSALQFALKMGATQGPCPVKKIQICNIPPARPLTAATITIEEKQWPKYQLRGAVKGPCSTKLVTVCLRGTEAKVTETALRAVIKAGGKEGPCPPKQIQICHIPPGKPQDAKTITILEKDWPTYQASGSTKFPCSTQKVSICWDGNAFLITQTALQAALANGATQGPCPPKQIQICHIPPSSPQTASTIMIDETKWTTYQAMGAVKGPCSPTTKQVCLNGKPYTVTVTAWPALQSKGATEGPCPQMLTICHFPPDNPNAPVTIQVPPNQFYSYLANGDVSGECNLTPMRICYKEPGSDGGPREIEIPTSAWPRYQQKGARQGECPNEILICHIPPGGIVFPTTMLIPEEEWEAYAQNYDHKGECSHVEIEVCHLPPGGTQRVTFKVSESNWRYLQAKGATRGRCPENTGGSDRINGSGGSGGLTPKSKLEKGTSTPTPVKKPKTVKPSPTKKPTTVKSTPTKKPTTVKKPTAVKTGGKGALKGKTIVICHKPPKNPSRPVTMTIAAKDWPVYQKRGATKGPCVGGKKLSR